MLTGLKLGNFKAFGDTQNIPIKPLTLIYGANSAGKSSIIHGLLLGCQANKTGNLDIHKVNIAGDSVDLGGFRQYVHRRDTKNIVAWNLEIGLSDPLEDLHLIQRSYEARNHAFNLELEMYDMLKLIYKNAKKLRVSLQIEWVSDDSLARVHSCEIFADDVLLVRLTNFFKGKLRRDYINYKHDIFRLLWEYADKEESANDHAAYNGEERGNYSDIVESLDDSAEQEMTAEQSPFLFTGWYTGNLFPTNYVFLPDHYSFLNGRAHQAANASYNRRIEDPDFRAAREAAESKQGSASSYGMLTDSLLQKVDVLMQESVETYKAFQEAGYMEHWFVESVVAKIVHHVANLALNSLESVYYLGPMRYYPPRNFVSSDSKGSDRHTGGHEWDVVRRDAKVREAINRWLGSERLQTQYEMSVRRYTADDRASDYLEELVLRDKRFDTVVSHRDVGFGISQVLPVLVSAYASKNRTIAIEQPEIHLHPALQAELGDVFIESALGENRNTFLLETHSEHLLLRIMRRMRETANGTLPEGVSPVRPEDVAVLFVQPKQDNSTSVVTELRLDEDGSLIDEWPGGFFEEGFKERFA